MERWRLLTSDGAEAAAGLALDEALMAGYARAARPRPPTLRLYTYRDHCVLVGRYQHLDAEIDADACDRAGVAVNRRPTGGGAIIMGEDQLGVAVVMATPAEHPRALLRRLSRGIVEGLALLAIDAAFGGKNDLEVNGRKIAGLGIYLDGHGALLFHASILADLDVPFMLDVLSIPPAKLGPRGIAAVGERVTTVSRETGERWSGAGLRESIARGFAHALQADLVPDEPDPDEVERAERLRRERYETDAWRHQVHPGTDASGSVALRTPGGVVRCYVALVGTTIKSVLFAGDFNELPRSVTQFETALKWARFEADAVDRVGRAVFGDMTELGVPTEVLVQTVIRAGTRGRRLERAAPVRTAGSCYYPQTEGSRS